MGKYGTVNQWSRYRFFSLMLLMALGACSLQGRIAQDINLAFDYTDIRTYSILDHHPLDLTGEGSAGAARLFEDNVNLQSAVRAVLSSHSLVQAESLQDAQVLIAMSYGPRRQIRLYENYAKLGIRSWFWSENPMRERYGPDTLAVDIFDAVTGNAIWHAYTPLSRWGSKDATVSEKIQQALPALLAMFPPDIARLTRQSSVPRIVFVH